MERGANFDPQGIMSPSGSDSAYLALVQSVQDIFVAAKRKDGDDNEEEDGDGGSKGKGKKAKLRGDYSPLNLWGAETGTYLRGYESTAAGIEVQLTSGRILPIRDCVEAEVAHYKDKEELSPAGKVIFNLYKEQFGTETQFIKALERRLEKKHLTADAKVVDTEDGGGNGDYGTMDRSASNVLTEPRNNPDTFLTYAQARLAVNKNKMDQIQKSSCTFRLVKMGKLLEYAKLSTISEEFMKLSDRTDLVCEQFTSKIAEKLCFQCGWYEPCRGVSSGVVESDFEGVQYYISLRTQSIRPLYTAADETADGGKMTMKRVPPFEGYKYYKAGPAIIMAKIVTPLDPERKKTVGDWFDEMWVKFAKGRPEKYQSEASRVELKAFMEGTLCKLAPTFLKSFMQKIVRLQIYTVKRKDQSFYGPDMLTACVLALIFSRGSFNTDVSKFIRGVTDAFKRGVVMMFEDAWPEFDKENNKSSPKVVAYLAAALLTAEVGDYWPDHLLIKNLLSDLRSAWHSPRALVYTSLAQFNADGKSLPKGNTTLMYKYATQMPYNDPGTCYDLLATIGSMEGDRVMTYDLFQTMRSKEVRVRSPSFVNTLEVPLSLSLDQHCSRGIGYLLAQMKFKTLSKERSQKGFVEIFGWLFGTYTGRNFRRHTSWNADEQHDVGLITQVTDLVLDVIISAKGKIAEEQGGAGDKDILVPEFEVAEDDDGTGGDEEVDDGGEDENDEDETAASSSSSSITIQIPLVVPCGLLSAVVGPKGFKGSDKKAYIILLNLDEPERFAVMCKPQRSSKESSDLFTVPPEIRAEAEAWLKKTPLTISNKIIKKIFALRHELGDWTKLKSITARCGEVDGWVLSISGGYSSKWIDIVTQPVRSVNWTGEKEVDDDNGVDMTITVGSAPTLKNGATVSDWTPYAEMVCALPSFKASAQVTFRHTPAAVIKNPMEMIDAHTLSLLTEALRTLPSGKVAIRRLLALMRDAALTSLKQVRFPKPSRAGTQAGDDLSWYTFDLDAFTIALWLANFWPGALRLGDPPNFTIVDPLLYMALYDSVSRMADLVGTTATTTATGQPVFGTPYHFASPWHNTFKNSEFKPTEGQQRILDQLCGEYNAKPGQFVYCPPGFGKSKVAVDFTRFLVDQRELKDCKYILWVAPKSVLQYKTMEGIREIRKQGVVKYAVLDRTGVGKDSKLEYLSKDLKPYHITLVNSDHLRSMTDYLATLAPEMIIIADEVDTMYALGTQRTSSALMLAGMAKRVLSMTGTMIRNNKEKGVVYWVKLSYPMVPITPQNWLVSLSNIAIESLEVKVDVNNKEELIRVEGGNQLADDLVRQSKLLEAASLIYMNTVSGFVAAIKMCVDKQHEQVLAVADSEKHKQALLAKLDKQGIRAAGHEKGPDASYPVIVVTKKECRGYNWAIRMGVLITMPYFSNSADRRQMEGRLKRNGQKRKAITHLMLIPEGTFLARVYGKHLLTDLKSAAIEAVKQGRD